jgi:uncharacterized protein (DUF305 family)
VPVRPAPRPGPLVGLVAALVLAGCGGSSGDAVPSPGASRADEAFVLHMLVHHRRAIAVGRLAERRGTDPRVRAFGARIVREQTPEAERLAAWVRTLGLTTSPSDAGMATGFVDDDEYRRLGRASARRFDREVLLASARRETGAAAMAREELRSGTYGPARALARAIAGAPRGQIPQLRALAADLPR